MANAVMGAPGVTGLTKTLNEASSYPQRDHIYHQYQHTRFFTPTTNLAWSSFDMRREGSQTGKGLFLNRYQMLNLAL